MNGVKSEQNSTAVRFSMEDDEHVFDNPYIRTTFVLLYTIIFIFCFFGNLAVVLVVTLHWKMRNITKFFLGNLAFANLCVGIFCVYQNLTTYIFDSWLYGDFMCKMYHFIESLCHTASILILIAIAAERYLVLLHPFKSRRVLTIQRLTIIITAIWVLSAGISSPRLYYFGTAKIPVFRGKSETICIPRKTKYHSPTMDTAHFILLYVLPLCVISFLYSRIARHLRRCENQRHELSHGERRRGHSVGSVMVEFDAARTRRPSLLERMLKRRHSTPGCVLNRLDYPPPPATSQFTIDFSGQMREYANGGPTMWNIKGKAHCFAWKSQRKGRGSVEQRDSEITEIASIPIQSSQSYEKGLRAPLTTSVNMVEDRRHTWPRLIKKIQSSRKTSGRLSKSVTLPRATAAQLSSPSPSPPAAAHAVVVAAAAEDEEEVQRFITGGRRLIRTSTCQIQYQQRQCAVRLFIVIVVSFAALNLPFHIRKLVLNYLPSYYKANSDLSHLMSPLTFLLMYANCAINPILYAFMSERFRQSFGDLIRRRFGSSRRLQGFG